MLVLTADDVRQALPMDQAISAMKRAYAALSGGRAQVPLRGRLSVPPHEGLSLLMPAFVEDDSGEALAIKVVSLFPGNPKRGLDLIQAAVITLEADTGRVIALLEGSSLTAIRTGAASGAAIDLLSRPESTVVAIFGAGAQGRTQLEAACTARHISTAWIYDPTPGKAEGLVADMAGAGSVPRDLRIARDAKEAVAQADIICTATTSSTPVYRASDLKKGAHISAVGSYTPEMQETPTEVVEQAMVVVDSRPAALAETGDLIQPIRAGRFHDSRIHAELGEVILGQKQGRSAPSQLTFFKSVGVAVQDAAAAALAVSNAQRMSLGLEVPF